MLAMIAGLLLIALPIAIISQKFQDPLNFGFAFFFKWYSNQRF